MAGKYSSVRMRQMTIVPRLLRDEVRSMITRTKGGGGEGSLRFTRPLAREAEFETGDEILEA